MIITTVIAPQPSLSPFSVCIFCDFYFYGPTKCVGLIRSLLHASIPSYSYVNNTFSTYARSITPPLSSVWLFVYIKVSNCKIIRVQIQNWHIIKNIKKNCHLGRGIFDESWIMNRRHITQLESIEFTSHYEALDRHLSPLTYLWIIKTCFLH